MSYYDPTPMARSPYEEPYYGFGRDMAVGRLLKKIETALFFILIFLFSTAFVALLMMDLTGLETHNPLGRIIWYPGYALIVILGLRRLPRVLRMMFFNPILMICILWCALSIIWAVDPSIATRRVIALFMTTLFGLLLAARYDWCELIQLLAGVFSLLAVCCLFMGLFVPEYGIMHEIHIGAWRGVWVEKNYMGGAMTKGMVILMCAFAMRPDRGWIWLPMLCLCFALVLLSTSKTALLVALTMIGLSIAIFIYRQYPGFRILLYYFIIVFVGTLVFMLSTMSEEMLAFIGKDPTFTGRTDIWNAILTSIQERPWLGYGYGVYWHDPDGPSYFVRLLLEWGVPSAHNGWFETWLSAGAVAVGIFAVLYLVTFFFAISRIVSGGVEVYWVVLSTIMFVMFSLSESTILQQNDLSWVMFVATSAKLFAFEKPYWREKSRSHNHRMAET